MFWRIVKTAIFTLVVPGTVALVVPHLLRKPVLDIWREAIPGLLLFLVGIIVYLWCAWDFVSKGLGTPAPIDAPRVLVVKGLYRYSRNPMYVGVLSMIIGQAWVYKSPAVAWYACFVMLAFMLFVRLYEEPTLRRLFGAQYEEYCRRVPRWILPLPRSVAK